MTESEDRYLQHPQLPVPQVEEKHGPRQCIGFRISSVDLNPLLHKVCLGSSEKALFVSLIRKVNNEEPCADRHDLGEKSFYNLVECQRMVIDDAMDLRSDCLQRSTAILAVHRHLPFASGHKPGCWRIPLQIPR